MITDWSELKYWESGEWQVIQEKLDDLDRSGISYNPSRRVLFDAMAKCPFSTVRVAIVGQDPYPLKEHATGLAFSIPSSIKIDKFPPSLKNIFTEYTNDLHYPYPTSGDLSPWCSEGVFLWNSIPTCETGKPRSHHWTEYTNLTQEIIEELDQLDIIFIFLGGQAREYLKHVKNSESICTSHPSPLGVKYGFSGSRIFSTANSKLSELKKPTVNWR